MFDAAVEAAVAWRQLTRAFVLTLRCNDHFGTFCTFGTDWTLCNLPLSSSALTRLGYGPLTTFNKANLLEIVFEVHRANTLPAAAWPVSFDFWVDDIAFY